MGLSSRVKGGSEEEVEEQQVDVSVEVAAETPPPEPQADFVCFYCYEYVFTGTLLYRDAEDPEMRNTVCCYKPQCRATYTSTEPKPEMVKTKNYGKSLI